MSTPTRRPHAPPEPTHGPRKRPRYTPPGPHDRARAQICAAAVAIAFGETDLDLAWPDRRGPGVDFARQVAMYLAHSQFGMTHTRIGALFGRDRSTVSHACRAVDALLDDEVLCERVDRLCARLEAFADVSLPGDGVETVGKGDTA